MDSLKWEDIGDRQSSLWYEHNNSDTVIVFIYGLHSKSKSSWLHESKKTSHERLFCPDLIRSDERFGNPALFLSSYYTSLDAGKYSIPHIVESAPAMDKALFFGEGL